MKSDVSFALFLNQIFVMKLKMFSLSILAFFLCLILMQTGEWEWDYVV